MQLSTAHASVLERYMQFREKPPTVWRLMFLSVAGQAVLIIALGAGIAFWLVLEQATLAYFLGGAAFGYLFRDFTMMRRSVQFWPVLSAVLDWTKVDRLLAGDADGPPVS
jgi:hypothetical protein